MFISIIIPSFNRAELLERALRSIVSQTSPNWECVVVDDFSSDNTKNIVDTFMLRDDRVSYYLNEHKKGAQGARNTGLDHAKYDWVIFFDSDNVMHHDFVERMLPHLTNKIDVCACCSRIVDVEKGFTGKIVNPDSYDDIHDALLSGKSYVDFNNGVIRKKKLFEMGCLDEDCPSMQEWDTHIRLSTICKYLTIEECLIDYYVGGKDAISSDKKREAVGRLYILKKHIQEWKKRPKELSLFSYQIYQYICMNSDELFVAERLYELKSLVPYLWCRITLCYLYCKVSCCLKSFFNR